MDNSIISFGPYELDEKNKTLRKKVRHKSNTIDLKPKPFSVLLYMVKNPKRLIERREFLQKVWEDTTVSEKNVDICIGQIRKAIGDSVNKQKYIKTAGKGKRGYIFNSEIELVKKNQRHPEGSSIINRTQEDYSDSPLRVLYGGPDPPFMQISKFPRQTDPSSFNVTRLYRIGVRNIGNKTIDDVKVHLESIKDHRLDFLPVPLHQMHDNPVPNTPYLPKDKFSIDPGQTQYIDVAWKREIGDETDQIVIWYAAVLWKDIFWDTIPIDNYELTILVTARDIMPIRKRFFLSVGDKGQLLFSAMDQLDT